MKLDTLLKALSLLGAGVLLFLVGAVVSEFKLPPYPQLLDDAFEAWRAQSKQAEMRRSRVQTNLWFRARNNKRGVTTHDESKTHKGFTFFTSPHPGGAVLVDMAGKLRHEWRLRFRDVWDSPPHVESVPDEKFIFWRNAHLYPNGDVIAIFLAWGETPYGYGMIKVDAQSNLLWKVPRHFHHDVEVGPDGTIYSLTHDFRDTRQRPLPKVADMPDRVLEAYLVTLSPDGEVQRRISLIDALYHSPYQKIFGMRRPDWDILHINDVDVVTEAFAQHHDFAEPGQVLISSRRTDAIALIDMDTGRAVWAGHGPWRAQHDPDMLPNGRMLVFDNRGHLGPHGASRVLEFDPVSMGITWEFTGTAEAGFYSAIRSGQQALPNGNLLITESDAGHIIEVTRDREIVWEFWHPARAAAGQPRPKPYIPVITDAQRIAPDHVQFELRGARPRQAAGSPPALRQNATQ